MSGSQRTVLIQKGVESAKDAVSGACDIIAESISDEVAYRTWIWETTMRKGKDSDTFPIE